MSERVVEAMTAAAVELLESFDDAQRDAACWPYPSNDERTQWFYTPTDHGGLSLAEMSSAQHRLVHRLLASGLSTPGYMTLANIMGRENVLDHVEGFGVMYGRERGRDPLLYYVSVFGDPGSDVWSWRFGGHHISLHYVVSDGQVVSTTPLFFGADPANAVLLGPHLDRPLAGAEDLGRELVRSLNDEQRATALVSGVAPTDLIGGNHTRLKEGQGFLRLPEVWRGRFEAELDGFFERVQQSMEDELGLTNAHLDALSFTRQPKGIAAADLSAGQREICRALLDVYVGRVHDDLADAQSQKVEDSFEEMHFLWAGGLEAGEPHYYRLQGGDLFVEYDNTARDANHLHSVWRDISMDFGGDPLAEHYSHGHDHN